MNKRELIQLVSEKLGAAGNEVKIAFDIFLNKIAEQTDVDSAIRIPEIGIFHLKKKENAQADQFNLLFLPLKYNPQEKNKILSFEVKVSKKTEQTAGEAAFDISIGKPLIPVIGVNRRDFMVQSSYIMLQKTYEERSENLLAKSVQLTDLKIDPRLIETDAELIDTFLDDYGAYEQINEEAAEIPWDFGVPAEENISIEESEIKSSTSEQLNREDDAEINIPVDEFPDFRNANTQSGNMETFLEEDQSVPPVDIEFKEEVASAGQDVISDESAAEVPFVTDEHITEERESVPDDQNPAEEESAEDSDVQEKEIVTDDLRFIEQEIADERMFREIILDEEIFQQNENPADESAAEEHSEILSDGMNFTEKEIPIEEFLNEDMEKNITLSDENINSEPDDFRITEEDLGLDNEEMESQPEEDSFTSDEEPENIHLRMEVVTPFKSGVDYEREDARPNFKVKYGLWFWIILTAFVVLTTGGLYYFLFYNPATNDQITENKKHAEQNIIKRDYDVPVSIIPKADTGKSELSNDAEQETESQPVENTPAQTSPVVSENPQMNVPANTVSDSKNTLIKEYIFSDGNKYTLQVSSWRTRSVAESESARLRDNGYPSYLSEYISRNGQKWYRVRVGEFSSLAEAEQFLGTNVNKLFK